MSARTYFLVVTTPPRSLVCSLRRQTQHDRPVCLHRHSVEVVSEVSDILVSPQVAHASGRPALPAKHIEREADVLVVVVFVVECDGGAPVGEHANPDGEVSVDGGTALWRDVLV